MVRIALIGLMGYTHKDDNAELISYPWNRLAAIKNVADFDEVIVYLPTLSEANRLDREVFDSVFNISNLADILRGGGRFIVVGDPRTAVFSHESADGSTGLRGHMRAASTSFFHWTLLGIDWDDRHCSANGTQFDDYHDRNAFGRYVSSISTYDYSLRGLNPDMEALSEAFGLHWIKPTHPSARMYITSCDFAASRFGTMLAGKLEFKLVDVDTDLAILRGSNHYNILAHLGMIVLLPESNLGSDESIRLLLEDAYAIQTESQAPEWAQNTLAPNQQVIDDEMTALEMEAEALHTRWQALQERRSNTREILRLLYGEHQDLEAVVRDTLRSLGADVEDPTEPNKRDGWLTVMVEGEVKHAVLEVKSKRRGSFDEQGLRQLDEWQSDGISEKGIVAKRLFIGNSSPHLPPEEREWPFGTNFDRQARVREAAAFLTMDLYCVYEKVQIDTFDPATFWKNVFSRNGALTLEDLLS